MKLSSIIQGWYCTGDIYCSGNKEDAGCNAWSFPNWWQRLLWQQATWTCWRPLGFAIWGLVQTALQRSQKRGQYLRYNLWQYVVPVELKIQHYAMLHWMATSFFVMAWVPSFESSSLSSRLKLMTLLFRKSLSLCRFSHEIVTRIKTLDFESCRKTRYSFAPSNLTHLAHEG